MAEKETQIGKAKMKQLPQRPISFKLKENAVKNQHLEDKSVSPNILEDFKQVLKLFLNNKYITDT